MVVTMPLGLRRRLIVAWTRQHGLHSLVWNARCGDLPGVPGDDSDGSAGMREPRVPIRPLRGGAIALPFDERAA